MSKTRGEQGVVQNIIANYQQTERFIVEQLYMENELHGPTTGSMRENVWRGLFEMIVPKKFVNLHKKIRRGWELCLLLTLTEAFLARWTWLL